jgi:Ala-tRNA(Pro) deacylase
MNCKTNSSVAVTFKSFFLDYRIMSTETYLNERHCKYERIFHQPTYSAQRLAEELQVPGKEVAKTVLLRVNGGGSLVVAVLPASKQIDFRLAAKVLGKDRVQLATELEIATHCSDCDFGVLPPFGSHYGLKTIVDSSLEQDNEIVFEGDTYTEAFRIKFEDFLQLEDPLVASFTMSE